jgi:hypothetical protein
MGDHQEDYFSETERSQLRQASAKLLILMAHERLRQLRDKRQADQRAVQEDLASVSSGKDTGSTS